MTFERLLFKFQEINKKNCPTINHIWTIEKAQNFAKKFPINIYKYQFLKPVTHQAYNFAINFSRTFF